MESAWDPAQYSRFSDHRLRPALDLLAQVPIGDPTLVHDLGCGTGNVTRILAQRWPSARVLGIDRSPSMLAEARRVDSPIEWRLADLDRDPEDRNDERPDLLFSNAALHWLPDHETLIPRLFARLRAGGVFAFQVPRSHGQPSHRRMRDVLAEGGRDGSPLGTESLRASLATPPVLEPSEYHELLAPLAAEVSIWETEYLHALRGEDPVLDWVRSTGLRPVLDGLEDEERRVFLEEYARRLREAYPARADGVTLFPFRRLFVVAVRPSGESGSLLGTVTCSNPSSIRDAGSQ